MSEFNFIQKPGFFQNLGNIYDKACGGTKQDRVFRGNYNSGIKAKEEAKKIYFRVVELADRFNGLTLKMLVFYTDDMVVPMPSLTGTQISIIKKAIKSGKGKGYLKGNEIELFERVKALPERVTPEWLFNNNKYYNVSEFMNR